MDLLNKRGQPAQGTQNTYLGIALPLGDRYRDKLTFQD